MSQEKVVTFLKRKLNNRRQFYYKVSQISHLKTKRRLFYIKTQAVPRSKRFSSRL